MKDQNILSKLLFFPGTNRFFHPKNSKQMTNREDEHHHRSMDFSWDEQVFFILKCFYCVQQQTTIENINIITMTGIFFLGRTGFFYEKHPGISGKRSL